MTTLRDANRTRAEIDALTKGMPASPPLPGQQANMERCLDALNKLEERAFAVIRDAENSLKFDPYWSGAALGLIIQGINSARNAVKGTPGHPTGSKDGAP